MNVVTDGTCLVLLEFLTLTQDTQETAVIQTITTTVRGNTHGGNRDWNQNSSYQRMQGGYSNSTRSNYNGRRYDNMNDSRKRNFPPFNKRAFQRGSFNGGDNQDNPLGLDSGGGGVVYRRCQQAQPYLN